jgi:hypothetical protein
VSTLLEEMLEEAVELGRAAMAPEPEACWRCDVCKKRFIARRSLNNHIRNVHKNPGICNICDKYFASSVLLKIHKASSHTAMKDFFCSTCSYQSSSKCNLKKHIVKHIVEVVRKPRKKRAFPCPVCDKVYAHKRTLDDHVKVKHKEYEMLEHTEQEHEPQVDKAPGGEDETDGPGGGAAAGEEGQGAGGDLRSGAGGQCYLCRSTYPRLQAKTWHCGRCGTEFTSKKAKKHHMKKHHSVVSDNFPPFSLSCL